MVKILSNQAEITYNDKIVETCPVKTVVLDNNALSIHKRALTGILDATQIPFANKFGNTQIIPFEIQLINYSNAPATGIVLYNNGSENVTAIEIIDKIPKGLALVSGSVVDLYNGAATPFVQITNKTSYVQGTYAYIYDTVTNTLTLYIPTVEGLSDHVITFSVQNDGTIVPGSTVENMATVDYNENPNLDPNGNHIPIASEIANLVNTASGTITVNKTAPSSVECNVAFTYTITATNTSADTQSQLQIQDELPANFQLSAGGLVVKKGNSTLNLGTDYTYTLTNNLLTITGVGANGLQLTAGQVLTVLATGLVPCNSLN